VVCIIQFSATEDVMNLMSSDYYQMVNDLTKSLL